MKTLLWLPLGRSRNQAKPAQGNLLLITPYKQGCISDPVCGQVPHPGKDPAQRGGFCRSASQALHLVYQPHRAASSWHPEPLTGRVFPSSPWQAAGQREIKAPDRAVEVRDDGGHSKWVWRQRGNLGAHGERRSACVGGLRGSSLGGDKARCCNNYIKDALSPKVLSKITRVRKM